MTSGVTMETFMRALHARNIEYSLPRRVNENSFSGDTEQIKSYVH